MLQNYGFAHISIKMNISTSDASHAFLKNMFALPHHWVLAD